MANQFVKEVRQDIGTTPVVVYETDANTKATIIGINVANTAVHPVYASIKLVDEASTEIFLVKETPINIRASLAAIGGDQKLVLEPNNRLVIYSNAPSSLDVVVSALEIV